MSTQVHILVAGLPLCGFTTQMPYRWPTGHLWVGLDDIIAATCERCLDRARRQEPDDVAVPSDAYRMDTDMAVFWSKLGTLIEVGRGHLDLERLHSVLMSRVARELRRDLGAAGARALLQRFVDTMEQAAGGDR